MRTSLNCLPCIVKQAVESSKLVTTDEKKILQIMKLVFAKLSVTNLSLTPPEIVREVHAIIREELHNSDPFLAIKQMSTERGLQIAEKARMEIRNAENPFAAAVAFAIAGNILDFAMKTEWNEDIVAASFSQAIANSKQFNQKKVKRLFSEIENAKSVMILGDNAGEAVFDRLLIEHLPGNAKVYYAVKSFPVINDVTKKEAVESGLPQVAEIIENGTEISGTVISKCSPDFVSLFQKADVVISKGQGNFETLNEDERKIWFLFQVKCSVIAEHYHYKLRDWMILEKDGS